MNRNPELRNYGNSELHAKLVECVGYERRVQIRILVLIKEIFARRLHLERGYSGMLEYLVKEMKYSESTALRRISAAKILDLVPEAQASLLNGEINMTQCQKAAIALRDREKLAPLSLEEKQSLTQKVMSCLRNQDSQATDRIIAETMNTSVRNEFKQKFHYDKSVTLTMTLSKDQFGHLTEVKTQLSHKIPSGDVREVVDYLCVSHIKKFKTSKRKSEAGGHLHELLIKEATCQYVDPLTQRRCNSTHQLEVDHIHPVWAGGTNDLENLRVLCAVHNKLRYQKQAGISSA